MCYENSGIPLSNKVSGGAGTPHIMEGNANCQLEGRESKDVIFGHPSFGIPWILTTDPLGISRLTISAWSSCSQIYKYLLKCNSHAGPREADTADGGKGWALHCEKHPRSLWFVCCLASKSESDSLRPHGLQHTRLPCPSLSLRVCSNSCPLSHSDAWAIFWVVSFIYFFFNFT